MTGLKTFGDASDAELVRIALQDEEYPGGAATASAVLRRRGIDVAVHGPDDGPALLGRCEICDEIVREDDAAEMYDPARPDTESVLCHPDCGLGRGLETA